MTDTPDLRCGDIVTIRNGDTRWEVLHFYPTSGRVELRSQSTRLYRMEYPDGLRKVEP